MVIPFRAERAFEAAVGGLCSTATPTREEDQYGMMMIIIIAGVVILVALVSCNQKTWDDYSNKQTRKKRGRERTPQSGDL